MKKYILINGRHLTELECKYCRMKFLGYASNHRKFCSVECHTKSMLKRVNVKCRYCGKIFESCPSMKSKFCSKKCKDLNVRKRGDLTTLEYAREMRLKNKLEEIIKLGGKCEKCGFNKPLSLEKHHDKKRKIHLFCSNCHQELHQREMITFDLENFLKKFQE